MQRSSKKIIALAAAAVAIAPLSVLRHARAADVKWDAGGADNNLTTGANWLHPTAADPDTAPGPLDIARFDALGIAKPDPSTAGGAVQYNTIFFGNLATAGETDAYTIGGANAITLGSTAAGNYLNNDSEILQTINAPINMIGGTVGAWNASLSFGGLFNVGNGGTAAGNNVTFTGANNITLAGGIAGAGTAASTGAVLNKTGTGTLFVTTDSAAWAGRVGISGGNVRISTADALGSGGGNIITSATSGGTGQGTLELDGGATPGGGFTLTKQVETRPRQDGSIANVQLRNVSGNNTVNNIITATGGTQFNYESAAGNLTIANWNTTPSGGGRNLRLLGAGNGEIQNWTPHATTANVIAVIKDGAGTWSLRSGMNTGTDDVFGAVTVNGGTLVFDAGLGARVNGTATVAPNVTVNSGGTLQVVSPDGASGEVGNAVSGAPVHTLTVKAGGTLNATTFTQYNLQANQRLVGGGTISTGGSLGVAGDNRLHIGDVATPAAGTFNVQGNLSLSNAFAVTGGGLYFDLSNSVSGSNDKITIAGDLLVDSSSGPVNLNVGALGAGFATGTYELISYTGASIPSEADFNLAVSGGTGATRQTFALDTVANAVNLVVSGAPANLVWVGDGAANSWEATVAGPNNWLNGAAADKFFQFDNVTFNDTSANKNVTINGDVQPSGITVDTAGTYTFGGSGSVSGAGALTKNGAGTLMVANTGLGTPTGAITINAGTLQIGAGGAEGALWAGPITNNGTLIINRSDNVTPALISGSGALVKQGAGDLVLNAVNTYTGATTIEAGRVLANNAGSFGDATSGTTVNAGASIYFVNPATTYTEAFSFAGDGVGGAGALRAGGGVVTTLSAPATMTGSARIETDGGATLIFANTLTGGTAVLTKGGPGTVLLQGTGNSWSGGTVISGGTLGISDDAQLSTGPVTINAGTLELVAGNTSTSARTLTLAGTASSSGLSAGAGSTFTLTGALVGTEGFRKLGAGTVVIGADNAGLSGTVVLGTAGANQANAGTLRLTTNNGLGSAAISMPGSNVSQVGLELTNNITVSNNITTASREASGGGPAIPMLRNVSDNNTYSGTITVNATGGAVGFESQSGTLSITGSIVNSVSERGLWLTGASDGVVNTALNNGGFRVNKDGAGTWTLSSAATNYAGATTVIAGKLKLEGSQTTTAAVTVSGGTLELANGGGSNRVIKTGAVTVTGTGRIDLKDNKLITEKPLGTFDGTSYGGIQGDIARAYNFGTWDGEGGLMTSEELANPTSGPLGGTTTIAVNKASEVLFIGDTDTAVFAGQTVTGASTIAMYTYAGDVNLDGLVDAADYGVIDNWIQFPGTDGYANGDFNFDGVIDAADYGIIDNSIQLQGAPFPGVNGAFASAAAAATAGASDASDAGLSGVTAVPEPASLAVVGLAAATLLGRRRRRRRRQSSGDRQNH